MQIRDNSKEAASGLDALAETLGKVKTAANGFNTRRVATQLSNLSAVVNGINASGVRRLNDLSSALDRMGKLGNIKISSSVGRQLQSISTAAASLQNVDLSRITALADTLRPLSELRGSRLTSYINQLGRLPEVVQALERSKLDAFVADIRELTVAMTPLGETMERVARGFNALPTRIQRMVKQTEKFNDTMHRSNTIMQKSKSGGLWGFLNSTHTKWLALAGVFGMLSNTLGKFVHDSASFEENLNLFTIAMGRYAEEAYDYAEAVQYALGIDVSAWMRNQGVFMQIATGFGVVEDKAYTMSQGLTQIAYDIASFYNIGVDTAMEKVQSGISGELEPLRRLGYALDAATLQQIAYEHGISQSINTMTQAQKSQLRYIAIMEQSENAMGDMARTIDSPANSMRVLAMQAEQLGRALGNLILPVLTKILPYVQAVTVALTDIINHLAVISGFTMPEISKDNMGGLASGAESVEDALLGSADAAKELRNATLGLDELNVISESSGVGTAGSGYDLPLDLESYKFFDENYENKVAKMAEEIKDALEPLTDGLDKIVNVLKKGSPIVKGFTDPIKKLASNIVGLEFTKLNKWLDEVGLWMDDHPETLYHFGEELNKVAVALSLLKGAEILQSFPLSIGNIALKATTATLAIASVSLIWDGVEAIFDDLPENDLLAAVKMAIGGALLGTSLGIIKGGGLSFTLGMSLTLSSVSLTFAGLSMLLDSNGGNDLLGALTSTIGAALGGTGLTLLSGKGITYSFSIGLALASVSLAFTGVSMWFDSKDDNDLMASVTNAISVALGGVALTRLTGTSLKYNFPMVLGFSSLVLSFTSAYSVAQADSPMDALIPLVTQFLSNMLGGVTLARALGTKASSVLAWTFPITLALDISFALNKVGALDGIATFLEESFSTLREKVTKPFQTELVGDTWVEKTLDAVNKVGQTVGGVIENVIEDTSKIGETIFDTALGKTKYPSLDSSVGESYSDTTEKNRFDQELGQQKKIENTLGNISGAVEGISKALNSGSNKTSSGKFSAVPLFASGGYPDEGQLFIARERGAEMVGSIGGRTAVANNDQIVEAIRLAVYDAMVAAGGSEGGDTYVYLDSDPVAARIEKRQREKGQKIYSGGVLA